MWFAPGLAAAQDVETPAAQARGPISIESFTRNAAIWSATLSPDGRSIAAIQESALGDVVTIIDWRTRAARATTLARRDNNLRLNWVAWKNDNRIVFSLTQEPVWRGERLIVPGSTRVFASDRDGSNMTLMFSGELSRRVRGNSGVIVIDMLANEPEQILLGTYAQHGFTVYRVNVTTGRTTNIVDYADWDTIAMYVDGNGYPVLRVDALTDNSGLRMYRRAPNQRDWQVAHEVRRSVTSENRYFSPLGAGPGPGQVYVAARSDGEEFQSIYLYNTATGALGAPVFQYPGADAAVAWLDTNDHSVLLGCGETQRWQCRAARPGTQRHFDALMAYFEGQVDIAFRGVSEDERFWLISTHGPRSPTSYYVYELETAHVSFVASTQPHFMPEDLAPMRVVNYTGRDGVPLWGYLTEPPTPGPHPLVVYPHGGPETRDSYEYNFFVQYLAWRGYAVFQPNFRGSEGSGRSFATAGYRQWGRRMQDDVTDGVMHLVESGAVDRNRMCIVGASYAGFAALAGAALTPDLYRCAVSIAGVSDLLAILSEERSEQGRGSAVYSYWTRVMGDPSTDRDELIAVSPARQAQNIRAPVLLIHGEDDWVVPIDQSQRMRRALVDAGRPTELIELEGEGHFWGNWSREHRQQLLETTDRFLAQHLAAE
ncbi:alpha/beta hydrolase family protein [Candidatus Viadribacter manganicus]|uniref:Peptidase S9 prolyl oligopeptidase catalytic domain-containing protein n=1 Tax=Candidatus Viadribacter manganicus TaxID=1759059 RepID=A0A1B1AIR4_9PROT|nr:alpha/beta fold hydrolase [Candidatus Viadribacter manganicus]ANP46459.1 hypothetical protein ATE48_11290 [Candidatus Viadribacter manganicus]